MQSDKVLNPLPYSFLLLFNSKLSLNDSSMEAVLAYELNKQITPDKQDRS
jgi:hypothetical protein